MKRVLIIVDYQRDFYDPEGALYVPGGEKLLPRLEEVMHHFHTVILTADYHPASHCSFKENGGSWPKHCVEKTDGCKIPSSLVSNADYIYRKGMRHDLEEYGAFDLNIACNEQAKIITLLKPENQYVVCGIVGDYCVLETLKNLLKLVPHENVSVYLDGVVSIDGGSKLNQFITKENLKVYRYDN